MGLAYGLACARSGSLCSCVPRDSFPLHRDGHHRAASAARARAELKEQSFGYTGDEEYNFFLAVMFPDDQLQILPYNRVVRDLNGLSPEQFLEAVRKSFASMKAESNT